MDRILKARAFLWLTAFKEGPHSDREAGPVQSGQLDGAALVVGAQKVPTRQDAKGCEKAGVALRQQDPKAHAHLHMAGGNTEQTWKDLRT